MILDDVEKFGRCVISARQKLPKNSGPDEVLHEAAKLYWELCQEVREEFQGDFESFRHFVGADLSGRFQIIGRARF